MNNCLTLMYAESNSFHLHYTLEAAGFVQNSICYNECTYICSCRLWIVLPCCAHSVVVFMQRYLECRILRDKLMVYKVRLSEYELVSSDED